MLLIMHHGSSVSFVGCGGYFPKATVHLLCLPQCIHSKSWFLREWWDCDPPAGIWRDTGSVCLPSISEEVLKVFHRQFHMSQFILLHAS